MGGLQASGSGEPAVQAEVAAGLGIGGVGVRGSVFGLFGGPAVGVGAGLAVVFDGSQQGLH